VSTETTIWKGTPSHVLHLPEYLLWVLLSPLVVPIFIGLWRWLVVRTTRYELTTERLKTSQGVFSKKLDELELYRVRDYKLDQPFLLRLFGLGNITLQTSDRSHPEIVIRAIRESEALRDQIRGAVESCRTRKNVREVDYE